MDPFSIGMLLLSAATSAYGASQAQDNQQRAQREALARQQQAREQANAVAMQRAEQFNAGARDEKQATIATKMEGEYNAATAQPAVTAQGVQVGASAGAGGADYLQSKAAAMAKSAASSRQLAALLGKVGASGQLRRDEAVDLADTGGQIGRISDGASNIWEIDKGGIQAAGQQGIGSQLLSAAFGAAGQMGGGSWNVANSGPNSSGSFSRFDRGQKNWL